MKIAVLIPCFNEELTIGKVIQDFRSVLPHSNIYVFDNNSTDKTADIAKKHGAIVNHVQERGKGNVVRSMFFSIDADIFLMVDGDDTYDPSTAKKLINLVSSKKCDMSVANRREVSTKAFKSNHKLGNKILTGTVNFIFGNKINDMLSGYRAMSRQFVNSFPVASSKFEIETEISVHALKIGIEIHEVPSAYKERPEGSISKLKTYSDGWKIMNMIINLFRQEKPLLFFSIISIIFAVLSLALFYPILIEFQNTGLVLKFPTLIVSVGISIMSIISLYAGLILDTVTKGRNEAKAMSFLNHKQQMDGY